MAQATYIVADRKTKSAFLVDPRRDVDLFLNEIKELGLQLKGVFITHMHADFVSGHLEVYKRVGCPIFVSRKSQVLYPHYPVEDGELLRLGDYRVRCIETPGHTPGCISFVVQDATGKALHAFTGDTLFVGSVGRPDLLGSVGFKVSE
jgi:glyoxylase-like metal-dependent hydrolase (beta-lactamase superfamily II)